MNYILFYLAIMIIVFFFIVFIIAIFAWRSITKKIVNKTSEILLSDSYQENLFEILVGIRHMGLQNLLENSLRAESGDIINRPLGSSKKWPNLDALTFIPAQTRPFAISSDEDVDLTTTIGPQAKRPLKIQLPLMISGMAYGVGVSEEVRIALATAANNVGIAINSGEGGILQEELMAAGAFILQYSKTPWGKKDEYLQRANMIEIKLGQGAKFGIGAKISPDNLTGRAREVMGLEDDEDAIIYEHFYENQTLSDLKNLVDYLRHETDGVPIGVKIGAGGDIEKDIDHLLYLGVDYIAVDGGEAATHAGAPILADDFGIPTLHAVVRAVQHLIRRKMKGKVSLIVSGGLLVPGHFLKVLALGADAVYLGSSVLFAVAHGQTSLALPFEPPTQVVWNEGKFSQEFDSDLGAKKTEQYLKACAEEMKTALRAMGKRSLADLSKEDLVSYDEAIARTINIPYSFRPKR
ncbi:MAG TPA: FMN-binding glutamate synthase family protein [Pseudogracilibacillus sp.]|nr:FMN-binding glutamate synthase family protein [Pseudogracilibacillus sp.]